MNDKSDKKENQYRRFRDYKDKGKKSCYLVEEGVTNDESHDTEEGCEVVYVVVKDDSEEEKCEDEKYLIFHVSKADPWIIDSGCSHHMTSDIDKFKNLEKYDGGFVRFGNDAPCSIKGRGSIVLNEKMRCDDGYWVKGLNYNLLSVSQLNNTGHRLEFQNRKVQIYGTNGDLIGIGKQ